MKKKNKYLVEVGYILNGNRYAIDIIRLDSNDIVLSENDIQSIKENEDYTRDLSSLLTMSGETKVKNAYPEFKLSDENDYVCLVESNLSSNVEEYIHRKSCVNDVINLVNSLHDPESEMIDERYDDNEDEPQMTFITSEIMESSDAPFVNNENSWTTTQSEDDENEISYVMKYPYGIPISLSLTHGLHTITGKQWQLKIISYYDAVNVELNDDGFVELIIFIDTIEELKNIMTKYSEQFV